MCVNSKQDGPAFYVPPNPSQFPTFFFAIQCLVPIAPAQSLGPTMSTFIIVEKQLKTGDDGGV